jgi:hypothetical protein
VNGFDAFFSIFYERRGLKEEKRAALTVAIKAVGALLKEGKERLFL